MAHTLCNFGISMYLNYCFFYMRIDLLMLNIMGVRNITIHVSNSETEHRDNILSLGSSI